jgi:hypothetical protein
MPYNDKNEWTPDPEDAVYTDPDEQKYINEYGNDTRFGLQFKDCFVPDPPEILKLKKSGEWAMMRPIHRRWAMESYVSPSEDFSKAMEKTRKKTAKIMDDIFDKKSS